MNMSMEVSDIASCIGAACENFTMFATNDANTCYPNGNCALPPFGLDNSCNVYHQDNCNLAVLSPFSFFTASGGLDHYSNLQMCCCTDGNLFKPFCISLLPFCMFYTWIRLLITTFNGYFIYWNRIKKTIDKLAENSTNSMDDTLKSEIRDFHWVLKCSYWIDFLNALICCFFFKGLQYYASYYYPYNAYDAQTGKALSGLTPGQDSEVLRYTNNLCLYQTEPWMMKVAVAAWFILEVLSLWIQIFAVSSITHLESYRYQGSNFYTKHKHWAMTWAVLFSLVGGILLVFHFAKSGDFGDYKLYYKYYSESTLTFWLCFSLVFILVLTDRYLAYEGFKKREKESPNRKDEQPNITNFLEFYKTELNPNTIKEELTKKFPQQEEENAKLAQEIVAIYETKMATHIDEIKRMIRGLNDQGDHQTSMDYIKFLLIFNVTNLLGYIFMLIAYKTYQNGEQNAESKGLEWFLIGFSITSLATFAYELTHNFLFYRSFFGPVHNFWKKSNDALR